MNMNKGFTLVELLIALFVGALMMTAVYGIVNMAQKSSSGIERRVISQKDVRGALDLMALELRMASYNPQPEDTSIWKSAANCTSAGTSAYKGIQAASVDGKSITIEMDANDSQVINDFANEIITYSYDTATQSITRAANCGTAQTFIGGTIVKIVNGTVPVFRYYDFNNNRIDPFTSADIPNIRAIEITLVAETEHDDPMTKAPRRIVYSTRVIPRNHGANP
jgi:type IV pilus assembly protein PilW